MQRAASRRDLKALVGALTGQPHASQPFQARAILESRRAPNPAAQQQPVQRRPAAGLKIWFGPPHARSIASLGHERQGGARLALFTGPTDKAA
jgi:hypothetical protein